MFSDRFALIQDLIQANNQRYTTAWKISAIWLAYSSGI